MLIVGLNAYHGDASAATLVNGSLVAAAEEERFSRVKHTAGFPRQALRHVVAAAGAVPRDVALVAVARDPGARLWHKAWHALRMPAAAADRVRVHKRFAGIGNKVAATLGLGARRLLISRVEHHAAHLASAFFVSPFDEAALFSIDGVGDFASAMWGVGRGEHIRQHGAVPFPHSLGILYTAVTQYLGFPKYGDEYKVMGLASYGAPEYLDEFRRIVKPLQNGKVGFKLDVDYFVHHRSRAGMTWASGEPTIGPLYSKHLVKRFGAPRQPLAPIEPRHENLAASLQHRLEEVILQCVRGVQEKTKLRRLCLAGGVAFNSVANGKILQQTGFDDLYIQSAAGDAGLAIGAATYVWHHVLGNPRRFVMEHAYWGPEYSEETIRAAIAARRAALDARTVLAERVGETPELCRWTAKQIAAGKVVGWFQGRMEWGPRALGNRSILADPRRPEMRDILNAKVKRREMFRPFAPSVLEEATGEYFEQSYPSPFMLMAYKVRPEKRGVIPATTHVDGTGRLQTVNERQNPCFYHLLREFERLTGVPVLLNTSFNENEPVVCTPDEAIDCFLRTRMDVLVLGKFALTRET